MKLLEEDKPFTDTLVIKSSITGASRTLFLRFIMSAWITSLSPCHPSPFHLCIRFSVHPCQWPAVEQRLRQSPCAFAVPKFQMRNRPVWACAVPAWSTCAYESMYQAIPAPSAWHVAVIGQLFWNFGTTIVSMPMHPHCLKVSKCAGAFIMCLTLTSFKHERWTDDGLKVQVNGWSFRSFIKQGSHQWQRFQPKLWWLLFSFSSSSFSLLSSVLGFSTSPAQICPKGPWTPHQLRNLQETATLLSRLPQFGNAGLPYFHGHHPHGRRPPKGLKVGLRPNSLFQNTQWGLWIVHLFTEGVTLPKVIELCNSNFCSQLDSF